MYRYFSVICAPGISIPRACNREHVVWELRMCVRICDDWWIFVTKLPSTMSYFSIELGTGYMRTILSKKPSAFTCIYMQTVCTHALEASFVRTPATTTFWVWASQTHLLTSSGAFMPTCSTDQIRKTFETNHQNVWKRPEGQRRSFCCWECCGTEGVAASASIWGVESAILWLWLSGILKILICKFAGGLLLLLVAVRRSSCSSTTSQESKESKESKMDWWRMVRGTDASYIILHHTEPYRIPSVWAGHLTTSHFSCLSFTHSALHWLIDSFIMHSCQRICGRLRCPKIDNKFSQRLWRLQHCQDAADFGTTAVCSRSVKPSKAAIVWFDDESNRDASKIKVAWNFLLCLWHANL